MVAEKVQALEQENVLLKSQIEQLENICGGKVEVPKNCEYCSHFIQHYIKTGSGYYPTCDGHCVAGNRIKDRKTNDTCKVFVKKAYGKNKI